MLFHMQVESKHDAFPHAFDREVINKKDKLATGIHQSINWNIPVDDYQSNNEANVFRSRLWMLSLYSVHDCEYFQCTPFLTVNAFSVFRSWVSMHSLYSDHDCECIQCIFYSWIQTFNAFRSWLWVHSMYISFVTVNAFNVCSVHDCKCIQCILFMTMKAFLLHSVHECERIQYIF